MSRQATIEEIAAEEATHAVLAILNNLPLRSVDLDMCDVEDYDISLLDRPQELAGRVRCFLAGPIVCRALDIEVHPESNDVMRASELVDVLALGEEQSALFMSELTDGAAAQIRDNVGTIAVVTSQLLRLGHLSAEEVYSMMLRPERRQ